LLRANVVALLNQVTREAVDAPAVGANTGDFYLRDLGDADAAGVAAPTGSPATGLDELLRPLPGELRPAQPAPRPTPTPAAPFRAGEPGGEPVGTTSYTPSAPRDANLADTE